MDSEITIDSKSLKLFVLGKACIAFNKKDYKNALAYYKKVSFHLHISIVL